MRKAESNWRRVPTITREAIGFVRQAAPGYLGRVWGLQAFGGIASALSVGVSAVLARRLVNIESSDSALSTLLPSVLILTVLSLISQFVSAYQTVNQEVVSEQVGVAALDRILEVVSTVQLEAFDDPVAAVLGRRTQTEHEFVRDRSLPERFRATFIWRLNNKDGATDARSHALTGEIRSRINVLNTEILDMKRKARRRQARLAFASNGRAVVIVGLTIAVLFWLFDRGTLDLPKAAAMLFGLLRIQASSAWLATPSDSSTKQRCSFTT